MANKDITQYSAAYKLDTNELQLLINILATFSLAIKDNPVTGYEGVTLLLLKALDNDVASLVRAAFLDQQAKRRVFSSSYYKKLTTLLKEVIIINAIKQNTEPDGFVSVANLAKLDRFVMLGIDRNMIHRTMRKYNIKYTKRRYNKPKQ